MQIYCELLQKYKFTPLCQIYKIAICLTVCIILMDSKAWVFSISVSQIIQTLQCKVNKSVVFFLIIQPWCLLLLFSISSEVQEHIIAAFFPQVI